MFPLGGVIFFCESIPVNYHRHDSHLDLLSDAGEMFATLAGSADVHAVLQRAVHMVGQHLNADVCSIYLYRDATADLILSATVGLDPEGVGKVTLGFGEGLVGMALKELRPICERSASTNPHYRYFPDLQEEAFDCFLAVPIQRGVERVGVIVAQRSAPHRFKETEVIVLRSIASHLAILIENANALLNVSTARAAPETEASAELPRLITGRGASPGVGIGRVRIKGRTALVDMLRGDGDLAGAGAGDAPTLSLDEAIALTVEQLEDLEKELARRLPEAASLIFGAHLLMLKDTAFTGTMFEAIEKGATPLAALIEGARQYIRIFGSSKHDYIKEKAADVEDLALRVAENLTGTCDVQHSIYGDRIVIAADLLPSDILKLSMQRCRGFVLVGGGMTSHTAILARSLHIPLLLVDTPRALDLPDGIPAIVDGETGNVYINPEPAIREGFEARQRVFDEAARMPDISPGPALTADGTRVRVMANINLLSEIEPAERLHADGVGLYRTEFPFLIRDSFPSQDEQAQIYDRLFERMDGKEITVRTLDVGGDKALAYYDNAGEANPEMGLRSIRFSLRHPDIFEDQICAILMAAGERPIRILFPMISSHDEFLTVREIVRRCHRDLREQGHASERIPALGVMVELPAVVEILDGLAADVDFLSIGTNDFVQYMLAADRTNERVRDYYCPHHPAVLRALNRVATIARAHDLDLSVCGEMAHEPAYIPFLIGIGVRKLSVDPTYIPAVKQAIAARSCDDHQAYAATLLAETRLRKIESILKEREAT